MIPDKQLWTLERRGSIFVSNPMTLDQARAEMARSRGDGWSLARVRTCLCCGEVAWPNGRCERHQDRNPCVVEGCKRTRKANGYLHPRLAVCGEHFKAYVRPGSRDRKVLNGFFRKAKAMGFGRTDEWPDKLERRYWVFWRLLMRRIITRSTAPEGTLDEDEIRKMFGWDDQ